MAAFKLGRGDRTIQLKYFKRGKTGILKELYIVSFIFICLAAFKWNRIDK